MDFPKNGTTTDGASGYLFLTLINSLFHLKSKLGYKEQYNEDYSVYLKNKDVFDFIVVGSGSAGSVVANRLTENPDWRVLVLEAGDFPSATSEIPALLFTVQSTDEDWQYKTEPSRKSCLGFKNGRCRWPRGRALGGTSVLNAMLYLKGNKRDYDQWAELGNKGWDWNSIKEQFNKLEDLHSWDKGYDSGDPIRYGMMESYRTKKNRFLPGENPENPIGNFLVRSTIESGLRENAAKAYLSQIKDRKNLHVSLNSFVEKVLIDEETNTATGVLVKIGENILEIKATKEVILSCGSINSPQILLLSGIGPKEHLKKIGIPLIKNLPVGRNLQDHLVHLGTTYAVNKKALLVQNPLDSIYDYFTHQKGPLATTGITNYLTFINTKNDSIYPNIQYHYLLFGGNNTFFISEWIKNVGFSKKVSTTYLEASKIHNLLVVCTTLLNPKSSGYILLKNKNPYEHPLIYSGYLTDKYDDDLKNMLEGIRYTEDIFKQPPLKKFQPKLLHLNLPDCEKYVFASTKYWECSLRQLGTTVFHPTGTCKMGPVDDGTTVVDSRLKVHGIEKLRVVDASVMPKIVSANTQACIMMIGFKGGEMIVEDWTRYREEL